MNKRIATFAIVAGMVVAGGLAAFQSRTGSTRTASAETNPSPALVQPSRALPTNHPSIRAADSVHTMHTMDRLGTSAAASETPAVAWAAPPNWRSAPNPSPMRLATYRVPHSAGDEEDAELSVTRAGGTATANIGRWIGQFDGSATSARDEKTVHGFHVTVVSVKGTFLGGGMMQGAPPSPRTSWALRGAIVEIPGSSYFFKLVGPASTLSAARAPFDEMIDGLTPS